MEGQVPSSPQLGQWNGRSGLCQGHGMKLSKGLESSSKSFKRICIKLQVTREKQISRVQNRQEVTGETASQVGGLIIIKTKVHPKRNIRRKLHFLIFNRGQEITPDEFVRNPKFYRTGQYYFYSLCFTCICYQLNFFGMFIEHWSDNTFVGGQVSLTVWFTTLC